jgi:hypothetical protein
MNFNFKKQGKPHVDRDNDDVDVDYSFEMKIEENKNFFCEFFFDVDPEMSSERK